MSSHCWPLTVFFDFSLLVLRRLQLVLRQLRLQLLRQYLLRRFLPPHVEGVVVFIVSIVIEMGMWRIIASGSGRLRLAVLHRVLVAQVLEDLSGVRTHRRFSRCFVALPLLRRLELLVQ